MRNVKKQMLHIFFTVWNINNTVPWGKGNRENENRFIQLRQRHTVCHTTCTVVGLQGKMCALIHVCFSPNFNFALVSICDLLCPWMPAVWPGDPAPVSGSSHFTNLESHTQLQGNLHWDKKLQLTVALPSSPLDLSDINFSWLTVN